jgi:hypothetical protein
LSTNESVTRVAYLKKRMLVLLHAITSMLKYLVLAELFRASICAKTPPFKPANGAVVTPHLLTGAERLLQQKSS